jgi:conjugal transfer pilus assembly protein TraV
MKKIFCILPMSIVLVGCSEMNSQFDCPMKPGIRCESISSINSRVDRGEIGHTKSTSISVTKVPAMPLYKDSNIGRYQYSGRGEPLRYGETVQRVWVAPFEDKQGNYHQESDIYTVVKPGHWIGAPLKETNADGE